MSLFWPTFLHILYFLQSVYMLNKKPVALVILELLAAVCEFKM